MAAGALVDATGRRRLTELGGLGGALPAVLVLYMVGALSISGAPLLNGFVSKSLIVDAAAGMERHGIQLALTVASVGTFLSVGLKLPVLAFGGPRRGDALQPLPRTRYVAMIGTAALCALIGVHPQLLYGLLPFPVAYQPYTAEHVVETLQLLLATAAGFALLVGKLRSPAKITMDAEVLYRATGRAILAGAAGVTALVDALERGADALAVRRWGHDTVRPLLPVGYAVGLALAALGLGIMLLP